MMSENWKKVHGIVPKRFLNSSFLAASEDTFFIVD